MLLETEQLKMIINGSKDSFKAMQKKYLDPKDANYSNKLAYFNGAEAALDALLDTVGKMEAGTLQERPKKVKDIMAKGLGK
jgi:hypothetical protein